MPVKVDKKELTRRLFGLDPISASDTQIAMACRVSEAVARDLVTQVQIAWRELGPGVLVIRRTADDVMWATPDLIQQQMDVAHGAGDTTIAAMFKELLDTLGTHNHEQTSLIAIAAANDVRLVRLDNDEPSAALEAYLKTWNS
jgi:hypothetical protein